MKYNYSLKNKIITIMPCWLPYTMVVYDQVLPHYYKRRPLTVSLLYVIYSHPQVYVVKKAYKIFNRNKPF